MSKRFIKISFPLLLIVGVYFLGSEPQRPAWSNSMPVVPSEPDSLDRYIAQREGLHKLKPNNEARIVWLDSSRKRTEYSIIYLHGFSASQMEGNPLHRRFAKTFGCNLYLARMADHGIDSADALIRFTPDRYWASAKEALAIGQAIGEKVIILSTSTGSTVALVLAAQFPQDVYGLINLSPNIAINNGAAFVLNDPWGLQIARIVVGGKYRESKEMSDERAQYWNRKYRLEAVVQLEEMLESKMNEETFSRVHQPSLTLYYYKNEKEQDPEVKVSAMLDMHRQLGTPEDRKRAIAMPNTGAHVLGSSFTSKDVEGVYHEVEKFSLEVLHIKKVDSVSVQNF